MAYPPRAGEEQEGLGVLGRGGFHCQELVSLLSRAGAAIVTSHSKAPPPAGCSASTPTALGPPHPERLPDPSVWLGGSHGCSQTPGLPPPLPTTLSRLPGHLYLPGPRTGAEA